MSGIPYLGSKISLISKSEIRYEGILVDVNAQESTITFEQVRFFGTEGRRPSDEIAAMDRIFDCVVFRSADIKDLQVYETDKPTKKEKEDDFPDPAVVSFASKSNKSNSTPSSGFQYQNKNEISSKEEFKTSEIKDYASAANAQPQQFQNTRSFSTRARSNQGRTQSTTQNQSYNNNNNYYQQNYNQRSYQRVIVPKSEFNFSQANAKFSKEEIGAINSAPGADEAIPTYNKNLSFFDDISCQTNTESNFNDRNRNERNLNMETFGQAAPPRRYGNRGGRGRGGYNRGGYNNINNNSSYHNSSNNNTKPATNPTNRDK